MAERIRHFSLFYEGRKVATINGNSYDITGNDEAQIGDEGYLGHSDGATQTKIDSDSIVPVKGVGVSVVKDMLAKEYVDIGMGLLDGKIHTIEMRCVTINFTGQAANGTLTGKFSFEGGVPSVAG